MASIPAARAVPSVEAQLLKINSLAAQCISEAVGQHGPAIGRVLQLEVDINVWERRIISRPEAQLLQNARRELAFAIYNATSGLYLAAFGGLRLFLELGFASVYFSVHEVERRRWMADRIDFRWSRALDEREGVLSPDFVKEFSVDAAPDALRYCSQAQRCYRACSQFLHGKIVATNVLPVTLVHSSDVVEDWAATATQAAECVIFALYCRYGTELLQLDDGPLAATLEYSFSHLASVQSAIGLARGTKHDT